MSLRLSYSKRVVSLALLGFMGLSSLPVWASDDFGADWQPKPLVDNSVQSAPKPQPQAANAGPAPVASPDLEARLKPVEPFIKEVENHLTLRPKPGVTMVQRLNTLQMVLFGEPKYQDAGELIGKLAEIFPQEAQKAQAELEKQFQQQMQAAADSNAKLAQSQAKPLSGKKARKSATPQQVVAAAPVQPEPAKKRRGFWDDGFMSDFENDPFFQDAFRGRVKTSMASGSTVTQGMSSPAPAYAQNDYTQPEQQVAGPSRLAAITQGLAGLALAAGGLAGAYYLNKKVSGNNPNYNNYYGNNNYGPYPNNYGYYPYGGNAPYAYNGTQYPYNQMPYGGYNNGPGIVSMQPYGNIPYTSYGAPVYRNYSGAGFSGSAFGLPGGNISPLGVPAY